MPGRHSRRSMLATMAAVPLAGALSACSGGTSGSDSTSRTGDAGEQDRPQRHARHLLVRPAREPGGGGRVQPDAPHDPGRLPADPLGAPGRVREAQQRLPGGERPGRRDDRVPPGPGLRHRRSRPGAHGPAERRSAGQAAAAGAGAHHVREAGLQPAARRRADGDALPQRPLRRVRHRGPAHLGRVRGGVPYRARQGARPSGCRPSPRTAGRSSPRSPGRPVPSGSTPAAAPGTCRSPTSRPAAWRRTGSG